MNPKTIGVTPICGGCFICLEGTFNPLLAYLGTLVLTIV